MKHFYTFLIALLALPMGVMAQGWPSNYKGVMLQGFYWDSFKDSRWANLESQANDFKGYFDLIWVPNSAKTQSSTSMGYDPYYYFNQNSSFGTEAELRSMIKTLKANGIGTIADVVINHRNTTGWFTFPAETYKGTTYQMLSTDIVANDDGGKAKTEADKEGVKLSTNNDEGEDWVGMRDLDHKSSNVQKIVKAYEDFLVNDLGYAGFRYDMVKGFNGSHIADYNKTAGVTYSVGEYWDGNPSVLKNWLNSTKINNQIYSAAFDFAFRYNVRDAINGARNGSRSSNSNWSYLSGSNGFSNLVSDLNYRRYAITFVENHDTQYRSSTEQNDPIRKDTLAANAFLLAMPGTPCVFYAHYLAYPKEIKAMIDARKLAGISNTSTYSSSLSNTNYYTANIAGDNNKHLVVAVGKNFTDALINVTYKDFVKILSGYHYAYYLSKNSETPWVDKASGEYDDAFSVKLTAVSATSGAQLVYTTDGTTPSASHGTRVASGSSIKISSDCTLTVGLLVNGAIKSTVKRNYTIKKTTPFTPKTITVYVNTDAVGWTSYVNFHSFDSENAANNTNTGWPGKRITATKTINGKKWFYNTYTLTSATDYVSFVFSIGTSANASQNQTENKNYINNDAYLEISTSKDASGHYLINDVTSTYTGISNITIDKKANTDNYWYTISGSRLSSKPTQRGIYIHNGKKIIVK